MAEEEPLPRLIRSFRQFEFAPNNQKYYVILFMALKADTFRIAVVDGSFECWISKEETFASVKNPAYSDPTNAFRSHLITALSNPGDQYYAIEEVNSKELKIMRICDEIRVLIAHIKCYRSRQNGKNMVYVFAKIADTLTNQQQTNQKLVRDNQQLQQRWDESLALVDEAILAKNTQEEQLMAKFVLILNEKKKHIAQLQAEIQQLKQRSNVPLLPNKKRKIIEISDDDDDDKNNDNE